MKTIDDLCHSSETKAQILRILSPFGIQDAIDILADITRDFASLRMESKKVSETAPSTPSTLSTSSTPEESDNAKAEEMSVHDAVRRVLAETSVPIASSDVFMRVLALTPTSTSIGVTERLKTSIYAALHYLSAKGEIRKEGSRGSYVYSICSQKETVERSEETKHDG